MSGSSLVFFTCVWSVFVLLGDGVWRRELWRQFESRHYPFTTGDITHSEMTIQHGSKSTTYGVNIHYHYVVDGRSFDGSRFRYCSGFSDQAWARSMVAEHPLHSQTKVYFNPKNPADSLLSPDLEGGDLMVLLFMIPFNLVMAGGWTAAGAFLKQRILHPVAGGVKMIVDGPRTNIRLPRYGALLWGMVAAGGFSFVSVFVLAVSTGNHPSMGTACSVLCLVIAAGVAAYLWQWRKIHSGEDDLILDDTSATIALPETYGRKKRVNVDRGQIEKLTVETIVRHGSRGGTSYTYAPTLWLRRNSGARKEKLADWPDRKQAEAFADWLAQRLNLSRAVATISE